MSVTIIGANGQQLVVSEKAFEAIYKHKGFTLAARKGEHKSDSDKVEESGSSDQTSEPLKGENSTEEKTARAPRKGSKKARA